MGYFRPRRLLVQALLTVLLVLLVAWRIDVAEALRRLRHVEIGWAALGGGLFLLSKLIQVYRWRLALWHHKRAPVRQLAGIFLVSTLANTLVPLRGGDLLRVQIASQRLGISRAELSATVFAVETPLNWVTLATLLAGVLVFVDLPRGATTFVAASAVLFLTAFLGIALAARLDGSRDFASVWPVRRLPVRARRALAGFAAGFLDGMELLRDTRLAVSAVGLCFLIWLVEVWVYWCLARAFGLDLSASGALVVMVAANLVQSTPLTPGHIGAYEVAVGEVAKQVGADAAAAGSFAVGSHLLLILCIVLAGIPATWALGLSLHDLTGGAPGEAASEASASGSGRSA